MEFNDDNEIVTRIKELQKAIIDLENEIELIKVRIVEKQQLLEEFLEEINNQ